MKEHPLDIAMELRRGFEIKGTAIVDGDTQKKIAPNQIQLTLIDQDTGVGNDPAQMDDDFSFTFKSVLPGQYTLIVYGPGIFIKSASLGTTDITDQPADLTAGAAGEFRIVLSTNTATIRATAPPHTMVCVQRYDQSPFAGQTCTGTQPNGECVFDGLAPGRYQVVIAQLGNPPPPRKDGQEVTVHEGETVTIQLNAPKQ